MVKTVGILTLVLLSYDTACSGNKAAKGSTTAALVIEDETHFYLGQPNITRDLAMIQSGGSPDYSYWHVSVPTTAIQSSSLSKFDLSQKLAGVAYSEHFRTAPGCGADAPPWIGTWNAGDTGVTGSLEITHVDSTTAGVAFSFSYSGPFQTPCGNWGSHTSSNRFVAALDSSL